MNKIFTLCFLSLITISLTNCASLLGPAKTPAPKTWEEERNEKEGKLFGDIVLVGKSKQATPENTGIGVNGYLWRASLETISFMSIISADPFGGVILTDWYLSDETPNERYKINVYITGAELQASNLKVTVIKQKRVKGEWRNTSVNKDVIEKVELAILSSARSSKIKNN